MEVSFDGVIEKTVVEAGCGENNCDPLLLLVDGVFDLARWAVYHGLVLTQQSIVKILGRMMVVTKGDRRQGLAHLAGAKLGDVPVLRAKSVVDWVPIGQVARVAGALGRHVHLLQLVRHLVPDKLIATVATKTQYS
jgi:hypothetical protein